MNQLVSIIMPSYNTADYLRDSIQSVIDQTYKNWELLIIDDCSSDGTDIVVNSFHDKRIHYFKNNRNSGAAVSRNRALREANGKWIAFLDSDDLWFPEKLEKQITFMESNHIYFSYTMYEEMNSEGVSNGNIVSGPKHITKIGMFNYCWPGCLTVMYDREYVGDVQIADIKKNNDYAMWLIISRKTDCYLLGEVLAKYRRGRDGSISTHAVKTMIMWHYKLFHEAMGQNRIVAAINTCRNLAFGFYKKHRYVNKV